MLNIGKKIKTLYVDFKNYVSFGINICACSSAPGRPRRRRLLVYATP